MAGNSPAEALQAFIEPLSQVVSCITKNVLQHDGYHVGRHHALTLSGGETVLKGSKKLTLTLAQRYTVVSSPGDLGPWKTRTMAYAYKLDAEDGTEVFAYHWHPYVSEVSQAETRPHVHLPHDHGDGKRVRMPTGRVAVEDVIRLLITNFGVEPLRNDWSGVLDESQAVFETWRTWA